MSQMKHIPSFFLDKGDVTNADAPTSIWAITKQYPSYFRDDSWPIELIQNVSGN